MYDDMSTAMYGSEDRGGWVEALTDAKSRYAQADKKEKCRWSGVIGIIQEAIDRGEPWPSEENA